MLPEYQLPPYGRPQRRLLPPPDFLPIPTQEEDYGIAEDITQS